MSRLSLYQKITVRTNQMNEIYIIVCILGASSIICVGAVLIITARQSTFDKFCNCFCGGKHKARDDEYDVIL